MGTSIKLCVGMAILFLPFNPVTLEAQELQPRSLTPNEALKRLKEGNARFVEGKLADRNLSAAHRAKLAKGQAPFAIVLGCADSRVAPELVFDQGLGDLFVVRVAGNVTDPAILGSIEYAVEHLHSPLIIVLGHEGCGAVSAALAGGVLHGNLEKLIKEVKVGKNLPTDKNARMEAAIKNNASYQAEQLRKQSPLLADFVSSGRVRIVTGTYSLSSGAVDWQEDPRAK